MIEEKTGIGRWRLPDSPETVLSGPLTFSPDEGVGLQLIGCFEPDNATHYALSNGTIFGVAEEWGLVTLYGVWGQGRTDISYVNGQRLVRSRYGAVTIFEGAHIPSPHEYRTSSVSLSFRHLHEWLRPFGIEISSGGPVFEDYEHAIGYRRLEDIVVKHANVTYTFWTGVTSNYALDKASILGDSHIHCTSEKTMTVGEWLDVTVFPIWDFLSFASGAPLALSSLSFEHETGSPSPGFCKLSTVEVFQLFTNNMRYPNISKEHRSIGEESLLESKSLIANGAELFERWFSLRQEIKDVINLYFMVRDQGKHFAFFEAQFLSAVQATEAYHTIKRDGRLLSKEDYATLKAQVLNGVDQDWAKRVGEQLGWVQYKKLHQRLTELLQETDKVVDQLQPDRDKFVTKIKQTRNYFTHYDPRLEKKRLKELELYLAIQTLLSVMEVLILRDLGTNSEESFKRVMSTKRFKAIQGMRIVS